MLKFLLLVAAVVSFSSQPILKQALFDCKLFKRTILGPISYLLTVNKIYKKIQAHSQEFAIGGLFRGSKTKLKQLSLEIGTVLCPKLGEDQKKKVFNQAGIDVCDRILFKSGVEVISFSLLMPMAGGYFCF